MRLLIGGFFLAVIVVIFPFEDITIDVLNMPSGKLFKKI